MLRANSNCLVCFEDTLVQNSKLSIVKKTSNLMSVDEAAEELDVSVGSQLAEVAVRNVAVLVKLQASRLTVPSLPEPIQSPE